MAGKHLSQITTDAQGSQDVATDWILTETCNLLRLAPETTQNIEEFVLKFYESLPSTTIVCLSLLGGAYPMLLQKFLPHRPVHAWMLLSNLNALSEPVVNLVVKDKQVGLAELAEQWILSSCKIFQLLFSGKAYSKALKEAEQFVWAGQEMDLVSAIFSSVNVRDMVKNMVTAKDWAESIRDTIQKVENWSCLGPNEEKVHLDHIADLLRFDPVHLDHITQLLKVVILTPDCNIHSAPISSQLVKYSAVLPWLLALL
ncbi:hypothetical protein Ancab_022481 [Ancistrocladus abbreviatus]